MKSVNVPNPNSGDEGTKESKSKDRTEISEEILLRSSSVVVHERKTRLLLTCFNSYPEFKMIGGRSRLKKRVCLKVCKGRNG